MSFEKHCPACNIYRQSTEFYKRRASKDGLSPYCKDCQDKMTRRSKEKRKQRKEEDLHVGPFEPCTIPPKPLCIEITLKISGGVL